MFVGREDIMSRIRLQFPADKPGNVVLLIGNRRMGKTSILRRLCVRDALPGWLVAYCSLQECEGDKSRLGVPTQEIYRLLATNVGVSAFKAGHQVWFPGLAPPSGIEPFPIEWRDSSRKLFSSDHPFDTLDQYLELVVKAIHPRRLMLAIDEFDKIQEGIDTGVTSPQVPANLRALLHKHTDLTAILSGTVPLRRSQRDYWSAMFGFGYRINVSTLPSQAAQELVTRPVSGRLTYIDEARDYLVNLCGQHPYLIQLVCNRAFEDAYESKSRTVTVAAAQAAATRVVREKNLHFDTVWQEIGSDRRRFLLFLCDRLAAGADPVNLALIETACEECGVDFPEGPEGLENDLENLSDLELLTYANGEYRLTIPLIAEWIRLKDFDAIVRRAVRESEELKG
jgi:type I restriction enzyme M protein